MSHHSLSQGNGKSLPKGSLSGIPESRLLEFCSFLNIGPPQIRRRCVSRVCCSYCVVSDISWVCGWQLSGGGAEEQQLLHQRCARPAKRLLLSISAIHAVSGIGIELAGGPSPGEGLFLRLPRQLLQSALGRRGTATRAQRQLPPTGQRGAPSAAPSRRQGALPCYREHRRGAQASRRGRAGCAEQEATPGRSSK